MSVDPSLVAFALVVFTAYVVQTLTGFGSSVVCVVLGAQVLELQQVITFSVPISIVQTLYVLVRHHEGIDRKLLLRRILPMMGIGMLIAFIFLADVRASWLKVAFGAMVFVLSTRELYRLLRQKRDADDPPLPRLVSLGAMLGAGIVHGIFAAGGPLLVYAVGREGLKKHVFRSTLAAVWMVLNLIMLTKFALEGRYTADTGITLLWLTPTVPLGIAVGEWLHHRVDERRFKLVVFLLLGIAAMSMLAGALLDAM